MSNVTHAEQVEVLIDSHWKDNQEDGRRRHLGGSLIGRKCERELWYSFRWATITRHTGRLLRLFDRGHKEEFRFVEYLRQIGAEVHDYSQRLMYHDGSDSYTCLDWGLDWGDAESYTWLECDDVSDSQMHIERATARRQGPTQWRISDVGGHFGGSLDAICYRIPGYEFFGLTGKDPILAEFKTHGEKSFAKLIKEGLEKAKPEHYSQMQTYMLKRGIKLAFYMAVNKNTDELRCYWVVADPQHGAGMISKARDVIHAPQPPKRISDNPTWFACRFCDHKDVCHMGEPLSKSCRSCAFSMPVDDGKWFCAKWNSEIPDDVQKDGCDAYSPIRE